MVFASFHSNGTIPSSNDKLNTVASGMLIGITMYVCVFIKLNTHLPTNADFGWQSLRQGLSSRTAVFIYIILLIFNASCSDTSIRIKHVHTCLVRMNRS